MCYNCLVASWIEHWVNFRNKKQIEEDAKAFSNSIFPYGEVQKEKTISILKEMMTYKDEEMMVYNYLVLKQLIMKKGEDPDLIRLAKKNVRNTLRNSDDVYLYLALALADKQIDEKLDYPSKEELQNKANELKQM